jgi:hypothetical protein
MRFLLVLTVMHPCGICGNEIADELAREGSVHHFVGPEPTLGVSRQSIKKKIQFWLNKQHMTLWQELAGTRDRLES